MNKILILLVIFCCDNLFAAPINTINVYFIGNSETDGLNYLGLKAMARERNKIHTYGRHIIPGAPLSWLWTHPDKGFAVKPFGFPPHAFTNYNWDAISIQPFDRPIEGKDGDLVMALNYINLAQTKNLNVKFYVYQRYPQTNNNIPPNSSSLTAELWNERFIGVKGLKSERREYFENLTVALRKSSPRNKNILMIPVGEVLRVLNNKMQAGLIPGYQSIWEFYFDDKHMNGIGQFLIGTTFYATIYQENPTGLSVPLKYGLIDPWLARIIQQTVWDVVTTYKDPQGKTWSGLAVGASPVDDVLLNKNSFSLAVNQSYTLRSTVLPYWATQQNVKWSSNNPAIASVSVEGVVTGRSPGTALISVQTIAGFKTASAVLTVSSGGTPITNLKLSRPTLALRHGNPHRLFAVKTPDNAASGFTWKINNPWIASIDKYGKITTHNAGTTFVSVVSAYNASIRDKCLLTVYPNQAPVAVPTANPIAGKAPLSVKFSGKSSYDNDTNDYVRGYDWDFGDKSAPNNSGVPIHIYTKPGKYLAKLRVMDNIGLRGRWITTTITVQ